MNNDEHISHLPKSSLNVSIYVQDEKHFNPSTWSNKNRRKSIIPSTHLPKHLQKLFNMDTEPDDSSKKDDSLKENEDQTQANIKPSSTTQMNMNHNVNDTTPVGKTETKA